MTTGKVKVKRLNVSEPMVGISISDLPVHRRVREALCRVFSENRINLTFLCARQSTEREAVFGCVGASDLTVARQALEIILPPSDHRVRIIPSVSLLSVFPHQSDFRLVGHLLQALRDGRTGVHALASSIAALTFVVDTDRIESAVDRLESLLEGQAGG